MIHFHLTTPRGVASQHAYLCQVYADNPCVLMTWPGSDPSKPGLLLNSHMVRATRAQSMYVCVVTWAWPWQQDVVPAEEAEWCVDPFSAVVKDGRVYGRGTQDMKCVGAQYLEAVVR